MDQALLASEKSHKSEVTDPGEGRKKQIRIYTDISLLVKVSRNLQFYHSPTF